MGDPSIVGEKRHTISGRGDHAETRSPASAIDEYETPLLDDHRTADMAGICIPVSDHRRYRVITERSPHNVSRGNALGRTNLSRGGNERRRSICRNVTSRPRGRIVSEITIQVSS